MYLASEADRQKLQEMYAWYLRQQRNKRVEQPHQNSITTPEVHIALTPGSGIPALTNAPGTGTGTDIYAFTGSAFCKVYTINEQAGTYYLYPLTDEFDTLVHNLSGAAVEGSSYITIARNKFGDWIVMAASIATECVNVMTHWVCNPDGTATLTKRAIRVPATDCPTTETGTGTFS